MTGLFTQSPVRIDAAKMGGAKQNFGTSIKIVQHPQQPSSPTPQQIFEPPPTRIFLGDQAKKILAQGKPSSPSLPADVRTQIEKDTTDAATALRYELEAVKVEADLVSGPTLRTDPELYKSIAVVGPYMSPQAVRSVILNDCVKIQTQAQRLLTGAASSYITPGTRAILQTVISDAKALSDYVGQQDQELLVGSSIKLAQDHSETHVKAVRDLIDSVEKSITGAEAMSVPVTEPLTNPAPMIAFGTIVLVAAILAVTL